MEFEKYTFLCTLGVKTRILVPLFAALVCPLLSFHGFNSHLTFLFYLCFMPFHSIHAQLQPLSFKSLTWMVWAIILGITACKSQKNKSNLRETVSTSPSDSTDLHIFVFYYAPYCKGIAPQSEEEYRVVTADKNEAYVIYNENDSTAVWSFQTNDSGLATLRLPKGNYCIKRAAKYAPFEDFLAQFKGKDNAYVTYGNVSCYYNWWKKCEANVQLIQSSQRISVEVYTACFTGIDPCKYYLGPLPP